MTNHRQRLDPKYPIALRLSPREARILFSMLSYVAYRAEYADVRQADLELLRDVAAQLDCELQYQSRRNPPGDARTS